MDIFMGMKMLHYNIYNCIRGITSWIKSKPPFLPDQEFVLYKLECIN